jgi:hypothetical protein
LENCGIASTAPLRAAGSGAAIRKALGDRPGADGSNVASAFRARSGSVFSVLTRRSAGARSASEAPSSARASPNARASEASSQSG